MIDIPMDREATIEIMADMAKMEIHVDARIAIRKINTMAKSMKLAGTMNPWGGYTAIAVVKAFEKFGKAMQQQAEYFSTSVNQSHSHTLPLGHYHCRSTLLPVTDTMTMPVIVHKGDF